MTRGVDDIRLHYSHTSQQFLSASLQASCSCRVERFWASNQFKSP
jgi:hypothetical protein